MKYINNLSHPLLFSVNGNLITVRPGEEIELNQIIKVSGISPVIETKKVSKPKPVTQKTKKVITKS